MSPVDHPDSLSKLLSDFLLRLSKGQDPLLADHPLLRAQPILALTAEFSAKQPAGHVSPKVDVAMGAIGDYWHRVFKPRQLSVAFRNEWSQYLVLAVAYFIPFRQSQGSSDSVRHHAAYPQSQGKLGELLSDEEYLARVLAEETDGEHYAARIAELCRTLVPSPNNHDKGAIPASTVGSRRNGAIEALAVSLKEWATQPCAAQLLSNLTAEADSANVESQAVAIVEMDTKAASAVSLRALSPEAPPAQTKTVAGAVIAAAGPYALEAEIAAASEIVEPVRVLTWLVDRVLANSNSELASATLADQARRLAQQMAAISLSIEPTAEPTTRLTRPNILLAMRRLRPATDRYNDSDALVDHLAQTGLVRPVENWLEFTHPALERLFAAEYLADYGQHWVSLRPRHRRLMQWTAAVLARRADNQRNESFCQDLGRALVGWCLVSLVDVAEILAEFRHSHTAATSRFHTWLVSEIQPMTQIQSGWLQQALWQCSQRMGHDLGNSSQCILPETLVPSGYMEAERLATDAPTFLGELGLPTAWAADAGWYENRRAINALLDCLTDPSEAGAKLRAASWLWQSGLRVHVGLAVAKPSFSVHRHSALEAVAQLAVDPNLDEDARTWARSILTRDEHVLGLAALGRSYDSLLFTLLVALDKRLFLDEHAGRWRIFSGANGDAPELR